MSVQTGSDSLSSLKNNNAGFPGWKGYLPHRQHAPLAAKASRQ